MSFNLKTAIGSIAPTLATMLGGPLAGTAVAALASAFGLAPTASADDVTQAAAAGMTPETVAAVRAADQDHAEKLKQMDIDLVKINADSAAAMDQVDAADRGSARSMQVAKPSPVPAALSIGVTVGYFAILAWMMTGGPDATNSPPLMLMLGSLSTAWGTVMAFWFGTTRDSGRKTELLAQSTPTTPKGA